MSVTLLEKRIGSSFWEVDNSLIIMGGGGSAAQETSEIVSSNGDGTEESFKMKYRTRCEKEEEKGEHD